MSYDNLWLPRKGVKGAKPDSGGAIVKTVPVFGIVKDNIDPIRAGRIRVYISGLNGKDPNDEKNWTPVSYLPPFFGFIPSSSGESGEGSYRTNPTSYGFWNSPPDVGTTVICIFVNGDPNYGFYIGCVPEPEAMQMVPAIGSFNNVTLNESEAVKFGGSTRLPVTNLNTNDKAKAENSNFLNEAKPVHTYVAQAMWQQGILRDPIRGPISSSANRETPSRVFGISTQGRPIYEGGYDEDKIASLVKEGKQVPGLKVISRRGGHTFVMDDGDLIGNDALIRLRTALGHQILMSDNGQTLMILHANGQSYIELGKEGTIDLFSTNSVNIRTQGDLNLHADRDVNINAAKNLNLQAESININSEKDTNHKIGSNYSVHTTGTHTHKVDGPMSLGSEGTASFASTAITYINGERINLNTGQTSVTPKEVKPIPVIAHTDTLFDSQKGFAAAPGKLLSITSRAPAHAPWASAGQGVDIKVDMNASSQLPQAPSAAVAGAYNASASAPNASLVSPATVATVPSTSAVSSALDKNTTKSVVGSLAQAAATGPAAAAVAAGAGVVQTPQGLKAAVGSTALTPKQLETAKVLKPGSAPLVNALAASGAKIQSAMSTNLFTGKPGAENLQKLVQNPTAQVSATIDNLKSAQTSLTSAGAITGKESPQVLAGLVMSGSQNGVNATLNAVKNISNNVTGAVSNLVGGATAAVAGGLGAVSNIANTIKSGSFAAGLAQNVSGGLGAISGAVGALGKSTGISGLLDAAKGVAGSAFAAITASFKSFKPNVPQNLKSIAESANAVPGNVTDLAKNTTASLSSTIASGVSALPGAQSAVATVVSKAAGATNKVPGTEAISGLISNSTTASMNNISLNSAVGAASARVTGAVAGVAGQVTGTVSGAASQVTGALDKLKSGSSLTSLASAGLPAGLASQLNSALSSLSASGSTPIKLPAVGIDTTNRTEITSGISSLLGPGIPTPNYTGTIKTENPLDKIREERDKKNAEANRLYKVAEEAVAKLKIAQTKYRELKNTLPEGDPELQAALQEYVAAYKDSVEKYKAYTASLAT